jgi:hypothetical protein
MLASLYKLILLLLLTSWDFFKTKQEKKRLHILSFGEAHKAHVE